MIEYKRLEEDITLSDVKGHSAISNFTKPFMLDRRRIKGAGNRSAKLVDMKVNKKEDYLDFYFLSEGTYSFDVKVTQEPSMELKKDNVYDQRIRILDFFKLLETKPNYSQKEVTKQDIKEVLKTANCKLWCSCPSQIWQGLNYYLTQLDGSIIPTYIAPTNVKNKNGKIIGWKSRHKSQGMICKHLDLASASISFFLPIMTSKINKYLKKS